MLYAIGYGLAAQSYIVQYKPEADVDADFVIGDFKASVVSGNRHMDVSNEDILTIEKNGEMQAFGAQILPTSWGLDRIDQKKGLNGLYTCLLYTSPSPRD